MGIRQMYRKCQRKTSWSRDWVSSRVNIRLSLNSSATRPVREVIEFRGVLSIYFPNVILWKEKTDEVTGHQCFCRSTWWDGVEKETYGLCGTSPHWHQPHNWIEVTPYTHCSSLGAKEHAPIVFITLSIKLLAWKRMLLSDPSKDCIRQDHLPSSFDNIDDRSDSVAAQRIEHELRDTTSSSILEDSCGGQRDAQRSLHWCENSRDERRKWTDVGSSKPKRSDWFSDMIDDDVHRKNRSMLPHTLRTSLPIDKRKNICLLHHRREGQSNRGTLWLCLHPLPKHSCRSSKLISRSRSFLVAGWQRPTWTVAILHLQFWRLKTNPLLASDESLLD